MKRFIVLLPSLFLVMIARSQEISQISFSGGTSLTHFTLLTDRDLLIRISDEGKIMEWGIEMQSIRNNNYYAPQLQPYPGRIEYYGLEADSVYRGKLRSIGSAAITYYGSTETEFKQGKIRTIGTKLLDYFSTYDNKALRGKLRSIGGINLDYYSTYDDQVLIGKLKSVGNTMITYYSSFDDKQIRGKLKGIGPVSYSWYTSLDVRMGGGLKSGSLRQNIAGITYIIQ